MGIQRLLPQLRSISRPRHLSEYRGETAGIDGHVWLHRSMYTDAEKFAIGVDGSSHVRYFIRRAEKLVSCGIRPIFVFDGADLPAKIFAHQARSSNRTMSMGRAIALRDTGPRSDSYNQFAKATDLRFSLVYDIVEALRKNGIEAVIAPYEADAQLAHLYRIGEVDFVITEDSDLLVYGCTRVLFKWDPASLFGVEVSGQLSDAVPFAGITSDDAVIACIMAGSDYGPGIRGLGICRAVSVLRKCSRNSEGTARLEEVLDFVNKRQNLVGGANDVTEWLRIAHHVFRHQTVFRSANGGSLAPLNPYDEGCMPRKYSDYVGSFYSDVVAGDVYRGVRHPVTFDLYTQRDITQHTMPPVPEQLVNILQNS